MNRDQILARLAEIRDEIDEIDVEQADEQTTERFDALTEEADGLRTRMDDLDRRDAARQAVRDAAARPGAVVDGDGTVDPPNVQVRQDPFNLDGVPAYGEARSREVRGRALDVIERSSRFIDDAHREQATRIVERNGSQPGLAELTLLRSSETYADAFLRSAFDPDGLSPEERQALRQVRELQRAMSLSDVTGVLVPAHLDPTLILSNDGTVNPFRGPCRVESGMTNVYQSVSSAGITAGWIGEGVEEGDDAPSFSNPKATAYKAGAFVPISIEAFEDARGRENEIVAMVQDAKDRLESTAFVTGNGSSAPRGLVTALDANTNVEVATGTSNSFALADVYKVYEALPARWRNSRTTWFANLAIINDIRQFGTDSYNTQTVQLGARTVPAVLGHPILESSAMDGAIGVAGTDNILVVGDPQQYLIYDRIGLSVELIPHLFGTTNGRPTGQRGWYAHWRTGANTTVDTAFRLLQAETNS